MAKKSLNYFKQSVSEDAKTNGYDYLRDLVGSYIESDPVALYDAMSDLNEIKYPAHLAGGLFSRLHKRGKIFNSGLVDGVVRASMQVLVDSGDGCANLLEWFETLKEIDRKNPGKDSLHDTALLYFFDVVDYEDKAVRNMLTQMIQDHIPDPVAQVGLHGQLKLNLVDLAYYGQHPILAHEQVMKTNDGVEEYALHLEGQETPRNKLYIPLKIYPYAHLIGGKTDDAVIDVLDAMSDRKIVPILNSVTKENDVIGQQYCPSRQSIGAVYTRLKPKIDTILEKQHTRCPMTREFIVKCCAAGFIDNPQFNAIAKKVFQSEPGYKTIDVKYQPAFECMLKLCTPLGYKPSFNEDRFMQMIQNLQNAGVDKSDLQACFQKEGCGKFIADNFHDSLPVFLALRDNGLMDLAHKDKRGWSAYSHMGKDGLQRLSAMNNAEHARAAINDIMAEMGFKPKSM